MDQLSGIESSLTDEERLVRANLRRFVQERYLPRAKTLYESETFPHDLIPELASLGVLGAGLEGFGCAGMNPVAYGLVLQELESGDSSLRSFVSVQGSLAMQAIHSFGTEAQKRRFLPEMAQGKLIGCFGLTEPDSGSDPASLTTVARKDGDGWILNGTKMWITNAPFAGLCVIWAKVEEEEEEGGGGGRGGAESIRGFLVERGVKGLETSPISGKMSLRSSETGRIVLEDCRVPASAILEHKPGLAAAFRCLNEARFGVAWGVIGAAKACFECVRSYALTRIQFGVPIAEKQLVQHHLVEMAAEIVKAEVLALHYGRIKQSTGRLLAEQVSLCKRNNVEAALRVARSARALLGANGILLDYPVIRHLLNLESVYTYEGTHEMHTLILGRGLTGKSAF